MSIKGCNVKKFAEDTTMHGFKELYYSKKKPWTVIWLVIITAGLTLTVFQITKSVQQFINQPTTTTFQVLEKGKIFYPPLSICYEHWSSWVDFEKISQLNITKPTLLFGLSFFDEIYSQDILDLGEAEINFRTLMARNKWKTLLEFYQAISLTTPKHFVNELEVSFEKQIMPNEYDVLFCYTIDGQKLSRKAKKYFIKSTVKAISFNVRKTLEPNFGPYLTASEMNAYYRRYTLRKKSIRLEDKKILNFSSLAFPAILVVNLDGNKIPLSSDVDSYFVKLGGIVHKWLSTNKMPCVEGDKILTSNDSCFQNCLNSMLYEHCETDLYNFTKEMDNGHIIQCRRSVIFPDNRGWFNISDWSFDEDLSNNCGCNDSVFDNEDFDPNDINVCEKKCIQVEGCEKWDYSFTVTFSSEPNALKDVARLDYTKVQVAYPTEEAITVIVEVNSQSWETFIANVGGLLGIWLGASIVTFIQTIYLCFCTKSDK